MTRLNDRMINAECFKRRKATEDTKRKITDWQIWECNDPEFSHDYDRTVSLYVQKGAADLTFADGSKVDLQAGDFLTIQKGASAVWVIDGGIRNCYCYHDTFESAAQRHSHVHFNDTEQG